MKTIANKTFFAVAGFALVLSTSLVGTLQADGDPESTPRKIAVTGNMDFSIVPPNLGPYLIPGSDGDLYLRHLPLVGKFTLSGKNIALEGKLHVDLNGELDITGTGVVWFPTTITATIAGVKTILFEGQGQANEVSLVATGKASLKGRGPYEGMKLELTFQELPPGDSNKFAYTGHLMPGPTE
jgi:hypothetical protein